ncbi:MAG TPA: efflux RND transporter periplasmic adaptor subunit [Bradyrhizobium sp.]|jgi:membrane fusion protein (multidrug efflux system)|uniref:efflux RND transporter periplasmic adaptor subunit n=1 Tax=Bradyrhizobium sp. TaxID=376 RepID=UPI002CCDB9F1|nr:efflux RND transporter periplasmic adaptor subunit [Bradyrhizobium sp.]HTB02277.1 efflux RND transporter periplasmic adaptor subunit [Bradyrhizobium sp.]
MRVTICTVFLVCGLVAPADAQQTPAATVPVGVVKAERRSIDKTLDFVGRIEAVNRVEIRARVQGFLEAVLFKEGDPIKQGDPLYRIEKGLFQAAEEQAEGALVRSKASKVLTEAQLGRAEDLLAKGAGTQVARDQAFAADEQAKGQVLSDDANLQTAKINLGYTDIVAPVSGRIGRTNITKGNVVGPESGPLTVVVSQDPMYVTFPVSQRELLQAQAVGYQIDFNAIKAKLRFADGRTYDQNGRLNFVDVTVDRATDTVLVRATFPNPSGGLIDGQLVRVTLEGGTPQEMVVVPQSALIADQEGTYVFVVEDGKAVVKRIKPGGESGTDVVVQEGLSGSEQVIVEGLQGVRPGAPVKASPLTTLKRS